MSVSGKPQARRWSIEMMKTLKTMKTMKALKAMKALKSMELEKIVVGIAMLVVASTACTQAPPPAKPARVTIEVWHDVVCPWCRIGLHNLEGVLDGWERAGTGVAVDVVVHPYLLDPDVPAGGEDLRERLAGKYGAERVEAMFARVASAGASQGVEFKWDRVQKAPNTVPGHALVAFAPADKRFAILEALHRAYFEEGLDIGDATILEAIAKGVGLDPAAARAAVTDPARIAAVRAEAEQANVRGIRGVPHFVIGGRDLHGAQDKITFRAALDEAAGTGALD